MRPTKSKGECSFCYHLNENKILNQIESVLKGMSIPQDILEAINEELKKSVKTEHNHQTQEINKLTNQLEQTQNRLKRARTLYLDGEIIKEEYQEITTELEVERQNLTTRLQHLQKDDKEFSKNISTIFEIASKSYEIFKSSELDEKRRIINILFPNLEMNQEKLVFTIRKPLDAMLNLGERPTWLPNLEEFRIFYPQINSTMNEKMYFKFENRLVA